jgi:hypothetical protein
VVRAKPERGLLHAWALAACSLQAFTKRLYFLLLILYATTLFTGGSVQRISACSLLDERPIRDCNSYTVTIAVSLTDRIYISDSKLIDDAVTTC